MAQYIARRLLLMVPTLIGLSILTFAISHLVPADPAALVAGPNATSEMIDSIREEHGLNDPLYIQYVSYVRNLATGDLGDSIFTRRPVSDDLRRYFPATLELILASMVIAVAIGLPLGVISALKQNQWPDHLSRLTAISFVSTPRFWFGILLQLMLASWLGILPVSGRLPTLTPPPDRVTGMYTVDSLLAGDLGLFWVSLQHLILPAFVSSVAALAIITRTVRGELLEVLNQDFVVTARAKGLRSRDVVVVHALRNAMLPTLTLVGLSFGYALGGSVLVETVFDWPGIGLYAVKSAINFDFASIMGVTLLSGALFALLNLIVDISYGIVDPRVRYANQ